MIPITRRLLLLFTPLLVFGQDIPIETWRNHFSYAQITQLTSSENSIICTSANGLFYIDKTDHSINYLSKLDGLSDVGASDIVYDPPSRSLVIGYPSGLIDIYRGGQTITVNAIFESLLVGDKYIRDIEVSGNKIYASNGFGIVVINLTNGEVIENFQSIGSGASDIVAYESSSSAEYLVAATSGGLMFGRLDQNLLDFNNWAPLSDPSDEYSHITFDDTGVLVITNDTAVFRYDLPSGSSELVYASPEVIHDLDIINNKVHVLINNNLYVLADNQPDLVQSIPIEVNSFHYDSEFWFGSNANGVLDHELQSILPNGPILDDISQIRFVEGNIYTLFGSAIEDEESVLDSLGYNTFDNSSWEYQSIEGFNHLTDITSYGNQVFLASSRNGLMNISTNEIVPVPVSTNTGLPAVSSLASGSLLYIGCFNHQTPLLTLTKDGTLTSYESSYTLTSYPTNIRLSNSETIWLTRSTIDGGGIVALDLENDNSRIISTMDGLPNNQVNSIAISLSDEAWVSSSSGLVSFSDASFIFDGYEGIKAFYEDEELFDGLNVTATAIDGGNRIWVGTQNDGVWAFNSSLSRLDYRFTFLNSPLPSNTIVAFAYHPTSGEMFILTDKGLASFRSNSSTGQSSHGNVIIYPNPVKPGYDGKVGISGLVNNASLKVTDVNGKLIRELPANGGSSSWNLSDYNNHRVSSGIYLIFSTDNTGKETHIGKLAVIN